jgi:hypothetical protein
MKEQRKSRTAVVALGFVVALVCAFWTKSGESHAIAAEGAIQSSAISLPVGTILPVSLTKTISVGEAQAGQILEAEIVQDVPLPEREKIHQKSHVTGTIISVTQASGVQVSLRFDKIEYRSEIISMATSLRALASNQAVQNALTPMNSGNTGSFSSWADTVQIGGDVRYGDGGEVRDRQKQNVGKGVSGGVLVHVHAQPGSGCEGPVNGNDSLQALWVFSSDACGVYGIPGVQVTHDGKTTPVGVFTLSFEKPDTKIEATSGMLLRVVAPQ